MHFFSLCFIVLGIVKQTQSVCTPTPPKEWGSISSEPNKLFLYHNTCFFYDEFTAISMCATYGGYPASIKNKAVQTDLAACIVGSLPFGGIRSSCHQGYDTKFIGVGGQYIQKWPAVGLWWDNTTWNSENDLEYFPSEPSHDMEEYLIWIDAQTAQLGDAPNGKGVGVLCQKNPTPSANNKHIVNPSHNSNDTFNNTYNNNSNNNSDNNYIMDHIIGISVLCVILCLFIFFFLLLKAIRKHREKMCRAAIKDNMISGIECMDNNSPTIVSNITVISNDVFSDVLDETEGNEYNNYDNNNIEGFDVNDIVIDNNNTNGEFGETYSANDGTTTNGNETIENENNLNLGNDEFIIE